MYIRPIRTEGQYQDTLTHIEDLRNSTIEKDHGTLEVLAVRCGVVRDDDGDRIAAAASKWIVPGGWSAYTQAEEIQSVEERRRWMYVASTRARAQLIFTRAKGSKLLSPDVESALPSANSRSEEDHGEHVTIEGLSPESGEVKVRYFMASKLEEVVYSEETFVGLDEQVDEVLRSEGRVEDVEGIRREAMQRDWVAGSRRGSSRWKSVGSLAMRRVIHFEGGGVGVRGGELVHNVMEHLELTQSHAELCAQVPELVEAFRVILELDEEIAQRCLEIVLQLLALPVIDEARKAPERRHEVPFAFPHRNNVISGRIDLCFPTDKKRTNWKVVDWKSHLPPVGSSLHDAYKKQLEYYAQAVLEIVTPCRHVDAVLAGPHQQLGTPDWLAEKLEVVEPGLVGLVTGLAEAGREPEVGFEPEMRVYTVLELAWPEEKRGLRLDLTTQERKALEEEGWDVVFVDTSDVSWQRKARSAVYLLLELSQSGLEEEGDVA